MPSKKSRENLMIHVVSTSGLQFHHTHECVPAMSREDGPSINVFVRFKQHVDSNIRSGIQTLLGGFAPDQAHRTAMDTVETHPLALDVFSLASWSYAPSNLRQLKQPVPNDLPPRHDSTIFTFEDAFEDLLAVSRGNPLPDINAKYSQRQLLRQMFPSGEPTWFWMRRLESQGLLGRPGRDEIRRLENQGLLGRQVDADFFPPHWPGRERFHQELNRRAAEMWRGAAADEVDDKQSTGDFFDEIHETLKKLEDGFTGRSALSFDEPNSRDGPQQRRLPDHFDDLFSAVSSSFAENQKTWDTFLKTIPVTKPIPADKNDQSTKANEDGNKEVVTRDEYVDRFGYLHTTVTRKTFDKDGNEIGSETHFTMRPAGKEKLDNNTSKGHNDDNVIERTESHADNQQTQDKKAGWFWK